MTKDEGGGWEEVLAFWYAPGRERQWFEKDEAFDQAVRERLAPLLERAKAGELDHWRQDPRGCLALVILLDQVPRNLYRGEARAFECDERALSLTRAALEAGFDRALSQKERVFLYLPLEHSESLADQERCVALCAELDENPEWLDYARRHHEIVHRFGRFPHRNKALGRESTPEEEAFLKEPKSSF